MTTSDGRPNDDRPLSLQEVARILAERGRDLPLRKLQELCRSGALPAHKEGPSWRVNAGDLERYLGGADLSPFGTPTRPAVPVQPRTTLDGDAAARARAALEDLKRKLEAERSRREAAAPRLLAELELATEGPRAFDEAGETIDAREGLEVMPRPDPPARADDEESEVSAEIEDDLLAEEIAAGPAAMISPAPEELVEEELLPGQGLRMRCELEMDEESRPRRHGLYESFHPDGSQAARGEYRHGRLEGAWQQWHSNGQLHCVGAHSDGLPHGPWTWWDDRGRKTQEGNYLRGRAEGLWAQFHGNGRKLSEGRYRDGIAEGAWRYWDEAGRPC